MILQILQSTSLVSGMTLSAPAAAILNEGWRVSMAVVLVGMSKRGLDVDVDTEVLRKMGDGRWKMEEQIPKRKDHEATKVPYELDDKKSSSLLVLAGMQLKLLI